MSQDEFVAKVKEYLDREGFEYEPGSISYEGLRPNVPQLDGSTKPMHMIFYMSPSKHVVYEAHYAHYSVYADAVTDKLEYIIGAQLLHWI